MKTCHGCNHPLEALAAVRTYHAGCDPRGRAEMLERVLATLIAAYDADQDSRYDEFATYSALRKAADDARAALAYQPAQTKGREG